MSWIQSTFNELGIEYFVRRNKLYRVNKDWRHRKIRVMESGDGWICIDTVWEPCTFYIEDILYRLDLQGKLP